MLPRRLNKTQRPFSNIPSVVVCDRLPPSLKRAPTHRAPSDFRQTWKPTKHHKFPCDSVTLPAGHEYVKDLWSALMSIGEKFFDQYLHKLAVDTNHVEGTFLITEAVSGMLPSVGL